MCWDGEVEENYDRRGKFELKQFKSIYIEKM